MALMKSVSGDTLLPITPTLFACSFLVLLLALLQLSFSDSEIKLPLQPHLDILLPVTAGPMEF